MQTRFRFFLPLLSFAASFATAGPIARAQQIKGRVMVLLDTSGSMGYHFLDPANANDVAGGDGSTQYSDGINYQTVQNWYPGKTLANGTTDGVNTRLYAAKSALSNGVSAFAGDIDFGLMTYDFTPCPFNRPLCRSCGGGGCSYATFNGGTIQSYLSINWQGSQCVGGHVLVLPGVGSGAKILPWVDGIEIYKDDGTGMPVNPELRADGTTPLAAAINYARTNWYDVVKATDPQVNCRPYVLIVETDGVDTCGGNTVNAATSLYNDNPANPVLTYVIGLSITQADQANMNATAAAGGTGKARFASNQTDIEAAYADILARSVKIELCNGKDDNCNGLTDEGFDIGNNCGLGAGACKVTGVKKCDPANSSQTTCCANDGKLACTPLVAGAPMTEVCNGLDDNCNGLTDEGGVCQKCTPTVEVCDGKDNDCDGLIDNHLVDVNQTCGFTVGVCKKGTTVCENGAGADVTQNGVARGPGDKLVCRGGVQPTPEICNGLDDNCDGITDGISQNCYDGPAGTRDMGICIDGQQKCIATAGSGMAKWGVCVGEILPRKEICNGLDDDCDGLVDDVPGSGVSCCPSMKCGKGICVSGTMQCSGGILTCSGGVGPGPEVCNGLDDDCNGMTDDLPNVGQACAPAGGCNGMLACNVATMQVQCFVSGKKDLEVCDGIDNDCDGMVDEPAAVALNDARIGKACGNDMSLPLPCMAGVTVCKNGMVACQGGVSPGPESCNCIDDDCNGKTDDNAPCPKGSDCYHPTAQGCGCYAPCGFGEFRCPGGYECDPKNYCVPILDCNPPCGEGFSCKQGTCHDKCEDLSCPMGYKCVKGVCADVTCVGVPSLCKTCDGASGEKCDPINKVCIADKCCGKSCDPATQFCDPNSGSCVRSCANVSCPDTQVCINGACAPPKCDPLRPCPERQVCDPRDGACYPDVCNSRHCLPGLVCVGGNCVNDNCPQVACPTGYKCSVNSLDGSFSCDRPSVSLAQQDRVVGAGGGGLALGCSLARDRGASSTSTGGPSLLALLAVAVALASRRRR